MLTQNDFVSMLGDMRNHTAKTIAVIERLITETEDKNLRLKFVALKQTKLTHLEAMQALTTLVNNHMYQGEAPETLIGRSI